MKKASLRCAGRSQAHAFYVGVMHMFRLISFAFVIGFSQASQACIIDPWYRTANEYEKYVEKSDFVFLGKLESSEILNDRVQTAEFTVIKAFKGESKFGSKETIKNIVGSSCSRAFYPEGAAFYVFATKNEEGEYSVGTFASFVPMSVAIETGMGLK